jgi:hypothetical protein
MITLAAHTKSRLTIVYNATTLRRRERLKLVRIREGVKETLINSRRSWLASRTMNGGPEESLSWAVRPSTSLS